MFSLFDIFKAENPYVLVVDYQPQTSKNIATYLADVPNAPRVVVAESVGQANEPHIGTAKTIVVGPRIPFQPDGFACDVGEKVVARLAGQFPDAVSILYGSSEYLHRAEQFHMDHYPGRKIVYTTLPNLASLVVSQFSPRTPRRVA